jgi:hypothetical protein
MEVGVDYNYTPSDDLFGPELDILACEVFGLITPSGTVITRDWLKTRGYYDWLAGYTLKLLREKIHDPFSRVTCTLLRDVC